MLAGQFPVTRLCIQVTVGLKDRYTFCRSIDKVRYNFLRRWPMNRRSLLLALGYLLSSTACLGQSAPGDSQTLQALLSEVRQLRVELRTTTIAAQRSQILIFRLQAQEAS